MAAGENLAPEGIVAARRADIVEALRGRPGLSFSELRSGLGFATGDLQYHLDVLHRFGYLVSEKAGRFRRFYLVGSVRRDTRPSDALARNPVPSRILTLVQRAPGAGQQAVADHLAITRQAAAYHLRRCVAAGLIDEARSGRALQYSSRPPGPPPAGGAALLAASATVPRLVEPFDAAITA